MYLKTIVSEILKKNNRSLSWLSVEMNKTFDGLKLSLLKGSMKYNDLLLMAKILDVPPTIFFEETNPSHITEKEALKVADGNHVSAHLEVELKNYKEMVATLKEQLKDKDKIIFLLSK
jgi:lambda repressor-like predicted transcriptional regulator